MQGVTPAGSEGAPSGTTILVTAVKPDPTVSYVSGGVLTVRPAFGGTFDTTAIAADGADAATITGLPNPTRVLINGVPETVTDGEIVFTTEEPGAYLIAIDPFPSAPISVEITAS